MEISSLKFLLYPLILTHCLQTVWIQLRPDKMFADSGIELALSLLAMTFVSPNNLCKQFGLPVQDQQNIRPDLESIW